MWQHQRAESGRDREYVPKLRSGPYAILLTLYTDQQVGTICTTHDCVSHFLEYILVKQYTYIVFNVQFFAAKSKLYFFYYVIIQFIPDLNFVCNISCSCVFSRGLVAVAVWASRSWWERHNPWPTSHSLLYASMFYFLLVSYSIAAGGSLYINAINKQYLIQ